MKNVLLTFSNNQFLKKLFYILKKRSIKNDEKKTPKKVIERHRSIKVIKVINNNTFITVTFSKRKNDI